MPEIPYNEDPSFGPWIQQRNDQRFNKLDNDIKDLSQQIIEVRRPNLALLIGFASLMLVGVPGIFAYIISNSLGSILANQAQHTKQIDEISHDLSLIREQLAAVKTTVSGLSDKSIRDSQEITSIAALANLSSAKDVASEVDRKRLNDRVLLLEQNSESIRVTVSQLGSKNIEIETQFKDVEKWISVIYAKLFAAAFPDK